MLVWYVGILRVLSESLGRVLQIPVSEFWWMTGSFQVSSGREWFIHAIYTIRSRGNANRGMGKRSTEYHSLVSSGHHHTAQQRPKRSSGSMPAITAEIGPQNSRGTNIQHIRLRRHPGGHDQEMYAGGITPQEFNHEGSADGHLLTSGLLAGLLILLILALAAIMLTLRFKAKKAYPHSPSRKGLVVTQGYNCKDSTEV